MLFCTGRLSTRLRNVSSFALHRALRLSLLRRLPLAGARSLLLLLVRVHAHNEPTHGDGDGVALTSSMLGPGDRMIEVTFPSHRQDFRSVVLV